MIPKYFGNSTKTLASGPLWSHVGAAQDDGLQKGEYCPTIYPVQLFNLLHSETVWLSPTPTVQVEVEMLAVNGF